jgi:hypothetical protein
MVLRRCLAICMPVMAYATALWGTTPATPPTEQELAAGRAVFITMSYSGKGEILVDLHLRETPVGSHYDAVLARRRYGGGRPPFRWADAQFPMEFSVRLDEDDLPDRIVLALTHKEPATVGLPPPYSATVEASLYLTTAPLGEPNLRLPLTSRPFHHPGFETRHTPHGMEVLYWEEIGTMKNGEFDELSVWTMRPSGTFERTLDPAMGDSVDIADLDEDETYEVVVHGTKRFAELYGSYGWLGELSYTVDIVTWDGTQYSRVPAAVARPYIESSGRSLVAGYLEREGQPASWEGRVIARRGLLHAIEDYYFWAYQGLPANSSAAMRTNSSTPTP